MSISDVALRAAKPTGKTYEISDGRGLSARVSPKGLITFQYRFRFDAKPQRMDLGHYPHTSLAQARAAHFEAKRLLERGANPIRARDERQQAERDTNTVEQLAQEFRKRHVERFHKDPSQAEQILRANVLPFIGKLKLTAVRRRDVVRMLERVVDRGARVMANRTASLTKQMFSFAVARGLLEAHPCSEITRTSIGGPEKPRQTYLSYRQIWLLWRNLDKAEFSESLKLAIKILLATGQRRSELMAGEWAHLNTERRLWVIPTELAKNGKQHIIHLTPLIMELFEQMKSVAGASRFFVPSPSLETDAPMTRRAINRAIGRYRKVLDVPDLSPHVLRHTFSTHVSGLGVPPHVVEKLLNHSFTGIMAVYNHQHYFPERELALRKWGERLQQITASENESGIPRQPDIILDIASMCSPAENDLVEPEAV